MLHFPIMVDFVNFFKGLYFFIEFLYIFLYVWIFKSLFFMVWGKNKRIILIVVSNHSYRSVWQITGSETTFIETKHQKSFNLYSHIENSVVVPTATSKFSGRVNMKPINKLYYGLNANGIATIQNYPTIISIIIIQF